MKRRKATAISASMQGLVWLCVFAAVFSCLGTRCTVSAQGPNMQLMDADALSEKYVRFLQSHSSWPAGQMEVRNIRINPRKIWLPEGKVSYRIEESAGGALLGKVSSMVTILVDGKPLRRARACADIEVYKKVLCASKGFRRGQIIGPGDVAMATMPLSKLKSRYFESMEEIVGMAARRTLRPGQIITADVLTRPAAVKRGSRVMIVAESPVITVRVPGQVEEKGAVGDFVRVKNLASHRVIIARVADSSTVKVDF
jgi:flagella basal body P-ring formation protein FlgA